MGLPHGKTGSPGLPVATSDLEGAARAIYVAYCIEKGIAFPSTSWERFEKVDRHPWIEAAKAGLVAVNVRVPIAIELLRLEPGLVEKLIRHGYGTRGQLLPVAILTHAKDDIPRGTGEVG